MLLTTSDEFVVSRPINVRLTWRYFAHSGRMPPIALVTVWTLNKDGTVTKTLCEHFAPNVVQSHTSSWNENIKQ